MKYKSQLLRLMPSAFIGLALSASSILCNGADDIIFGPTEASVSNPDSTWFNLWGPAWAGTTFDTANPPPSGNTQGSPYIQNTWSGTDADTYNVICQGTAPWACTKFDGAEYSSIEFDFKYDTNTSSMTPTSSAGLEVALDQSWSETRITSISLDTADPVGSPLANGAWHHVSVPISSSQPNVANSIGVSFYRWNPLTVSGNMNFWIANVKTIARIVPVAPPTLSISKPTAGLNFVQGTVSGQFDRQNIRTLNGATFNYSWVGQATAGNPVTYSFDVAQWNAPDLNYHIFITPGVTGGESASDYNEANVMIFQILQVAGGTEADIFWKTNLPSASATNVALQVTNTSGILGTWQLKFTSDTAGAVIAPDSTSYPFTVNPDLVTGLANPAFITFGVGPLINSNIVVGESVVISKIAITGAASLSAIDTVYTDVFTDDSALNTNYWQVNALYAPSIWFVPTNNPYCISWTIPDSGFSLIIQSNVTSLATGSSPGQPKVTLIPGERTLVPASALPAGNAAFFALIKRTATQLQVLLPGETNAPNTSTGKTGTPDVVSLGAGGLETVTINAVDATYHIVSVSGDNINLTCSDGTAIMPLDAALANGTLQQTVMFGSTGSFTVTATDTTNTNFPPAVSSAVTVDP